MKVAARSGSVSERRAGVKGNAIRAKCNERERDRNALQPAKVGGGRDIDHYRETSCDPRRRCRRRHRRRPGTGSLLLSVVPLITMRCLSVCGSCFN